MKKKILIIRFSSLGDIILTSPVIINLRINFPDSEIVFLTKQKYHEVASLIPEVDRIVTIENPQSALSYYNFLIHLDNENFDLILDLQGNARSWLARKLVSAPLKEVYPKRRAERHKIVRKNIYPKNIVHTIDSYNKTIENMGGNAYCKRPQLKFYSSDRNLKFENDNPVVIVAPGASHENKKWELDKFIESAKELQDSHNANILWVVSSDDFTQENQIEELKFGSYKIAQDFSISQLANEIAGTGATLSNDSGIAHLSSAVGTPVTAVFGPTHPALGFSPRGLHDIIIEVEESCRPCSLHGKKKCYREERFCFNRIAVADVVSSIANQIKLSCKKSRAVFLDRDGTLIVDKNYLSNPNEILFEKDAIRALQQFKSLGLKIIVITNQSGVGRGYFSIDKVEEVHDHLFKMLETEGVSIDGIYYCPHYPVSSSDRNRNEYSISCKCRKPFPQMLEIATIDHNIDIRNSFVIGDKMADFNLGQAVGATPLLVETGKGSKESKFLKSENYSYQIINKNLFEASKIVGKLLENQAISADL